MVKVKIKKINKLGFFYFYFYHLYFILGFLWGFLLDRLTF